MAAYGNTVEHFKKFLEEYSKKENTDEDTQPLVPSSQLLAEDEVKGEILDLCIGRLDKDQCPDFLKFSIANEVASTIITDTEGLEQFKSDRNFEEGEANATYYSASSLCKAALPRLHAVCMRWSKQLPSFKIPSLNTYSVYGIKNTRRKMEDKHTVITDLNTLLDLKDVPRTEYYAVFDGHGGLDASSYSSKQLHVRLAQHDLFKTDVQTALKDTVRKLDDDYCKKSQRDKLRSGTTAVICVIREETLYIAWIGDSQAVLVRDGEPVVLMEPHKPEKPEEKSRIEELGGCVIWFGAWRVNGTLSVSRAIGDADFKPFVCGDADSSEFQFTGTEDYLCIACDGFWDVFDGAQLVKLVSDHFSEGGTKESLSQTLCMKAKEAGSSDNITVLVVFLKDTITIKQQPTNGEKTVTNDVEDDNQQSNEKNSDVKNGESTDEKVIEEPSVIHVEDNVMVHGNKLQPAHKERPPHKLYVNKPNNVISKVSVIVTDSTPHARLPHSVVTHKSPWQSQVSPKMERRDTRGSLISQSTYEPDEITTPLSLWTSEHKSTMINTYNIDGLPAIVNRKDGQTSPHTNTPSPSCISEPVTSVIIKPTRPQVQRQSRGRQPYRTSIVFNNFKMDNGNWTNSMHQKRLIRRSSSSVPRHLNLTNRPQYYARPMEFRSHGNIPGWNQNGVRINQSRYSKSLNGFHKENVTPLEPNNNEIDTEIAITNSLYNRIKPKRSNNTREKPISKGRNSTTVPIMLLYRRQRSRSAM